MNKRRDQGETRRSLRVKKETLRGLGFAELDQVRGGDPPPDTAKCTHTEGKTMASRYCL